MKGRYSYLGFATALWFASIPIVPGKATPLHIITARDFNNAGLRGFNLGSNTTLSEQDLRAMRSDGANLARYFIVANRTSKSDYSLSASSLAATDRYVSIAAANGFKVAITLEPLPEGWNQEYWESPELQASIIRAWMEIAARYRCDEAIAGYDLINEPIATIARSRRQAFSREGAKLWKQFAAKIITSIRQIDPSHTIIFEPSPGALPVSFSYLEDALADSNIVYSTHMYEPHNLTHQGIEYFESMQYPTDLTSAGTWGKAEMAASLEPVRSFAERTGAPILVGEFGIVRWAPQNSPLRYLTDLLDIIDNQEKWSWAYQAWRECECWDAEIESAFYYHFPYYHAKPVVPSSVVVRNHRNRSSDAIQLLQKYFAKIHEGHRDISSSSTPAAGPRLGPERNGRCAS